MSLKIYFISIKFFLKDLFKSLSTLLRTLGENWSRGIKVSRLKHTLIKDMELLRKSLIDGQSTSSLTQSIEVNLENLHGRIGQKTLEEVKILSFVDKIKNVNNDGGYEKVINQMFDTFYSKLDNRLFKLIDKLEDEPLTNTIEYGEESDMDKNEYKKEKIQLQIELVKLQEWAVTNNKKICILFEGRDAAGKGSSIKRFIEHLNPKNYRVVSLGIPTKEESENWLPRYEKHLPNEGELVFFDRSWYNRGVIEPTMGYCTDVQYEDFMENVNKWEEDLIKNDTILIKLWFSINQEKQLERFGLRKHSQLKHWKYSPNDEKTISKWDIMTKYKTQMFKKTSTPISPWVVINSNDKRISRLNSIRYVLSSVNYTIKDIEKNIVPDPNIVKILK